MPGVVEKDELYRNMVRDFMKRYEESPAMSHAKSAGYHPYLRQMVYSMAAMQAAIIAGMPNIPAPDTQTIGIAGIVDFRPLLYRLSDECRMQAATGEIAVYVPNVLLEGWRRFRA
jgi:hypothetical protein